VSLVQLNFETNEGHQALRLDVVLASIATSYSRGQLQQWIKQGFVKVDGQVVTLVRRLMGEQHTIEIQAELESQSEWIPQSMPYQIVFEDEHLLVVNKAANCVVHPGAGNQDGTLVNALLHDYPELRLLPRCGIVHRLDKDTTGLMVVARTLIAVNCLVNQLQRHEVKRLYQALVYGEIISGREIDEPIARSRRFRTKMAVVSGGKPARTQVRVNQRFTHFTLLDVSLHTGRTHQIRVHCTYHGMPLVGDQTYKQGVRMPKGLSDKKREAIGAFKRQALHACELNLLHPQSGKMMSWKAVVPDDMQHLLSVLQD
jgi:23S rRNA pseudouridine1911/1915/1917 synthase